MTSHSLLRGFLSDHKQKNIIKVHLKHRFFKDFSTLKIRSRGSFQSASGVQMKVHRGLIESAPGFFDMLSNESWCTLN